MEHLVTSHIMKHADANNIMYPLQHGFRRGLSCETQLLEFIDDISKNLDPGKQTDCLIMDFSVNPKTGSLRYKGENQQVDPKFPSRKETSGRCRRGEIRFHKR
jgi:hypothetical protein